MNRNYKATLRSDKNRRGSQKLSELKPGRPDQANVPPVLKDMGSMSPMRGGKFSSHVDQTDF